MITDNRACFFGWNLIWFVTGNGNDTMCGSWKYPHPPQGGLFEIPRMGGTQKPKFLKETMDQDYNFQRDGSVETKNPL